jgi:hypothetical protein
MFTHPFTLLREDYCIEVLSEINHVVRVYRGEEYVLKIH